MIVSFLISQQNNITRIRKCIQNICEKYGEKRFNFREEAYYTFPTAETLAKLKDDELKACNLGYRSKYVVRTAKSIVAGEIDLEKVGEMSYRKAKNELLKLFGVGEKVADCICLFALHHLQSFPIDTHIRQVLDEHYKRGFPNRRYKLFGVGEKVADCICLFALHHLQSFPIDTHIRQVLDEHYKRGFPNRRYNGFQGVMQQ